MAPVSSALFLAIAKTSRLGVPTERAYDIVYTPSIPKPQLSIKNTLSELACFKYIERALAPKGFTALFEKSNDKIF